MLPSVTNESPPRGSDAFGLARLTLAALVIAAHTPELHDGNRGRELLTRAFGTISFGELAVDGFFIISGFLITGSYLATRSLPLFAAKRAARLLPGFWFASLVCVALVAPLGGGVLAEADWAKVAGSVAALREAEIPRAFHGLAYPSLNGAMWTLAFEARCYVLTALLGVVGLLRRPATLAALAGACLIGQAFASPLLLNVLADHPLAATLTGDPYAMMRLAGQFLAGAALWHVRADLRPTGPRTALALGLLVAGLSRPLLAEAAVASAGAWLLLAVALHPPARWMATVNRRDDVSYGVYLYAWPVTNLLLWHAPGLSLGALGALTLAGSLGLGFTSWRLVERPAQVALRDGLTWRRRGTTDWAAA